MRRPLARLSQSERGSAMVEFAILAPVMVLVFIGLIEISRYAYYALLAANAARAGAQYGAQSTSTALDNTGMQTYANADLPANSHVSATSRYFCLTDPGGAPTTCPTGTAQSGVAYYIEVDTTGTYNSLFKYPGIPQLVPVSGKAVLRVVNQ